MFLIFLFMSLGVAWSLNLRALALLYCILLGTKLNDFVKQLGKLLLLSMTRLS